MALPFEFEFYGQRYDTLFVNANGLVSFVSAQPGNNFPADRMPSIAAPNGFVGVLWDDWCAGQRGCFGPLQMGAGVFVETDNTPGAGRVAIEWRHLRHFSDSTAPGDFNFQLELFEGPGAMMVMSYGVMSPGLDGSGGPSQVASRTGIESPAADLGSWLGPCGSAACALNDVVALSNTRITVIADAGPDLLVQSVQTPEVGYPGLSLAVTAQLSNQHRFELGPVRWSVMLAPGTSTSTQGAQLLYESAPVTLAGFTSTELQIEVELPQELPASTYRILVVADARSELDEVIEDNNVAVSAKAIRVGGRAPDFVVTAAAIDRERRRPGEVVNLEITVANQGNEPGRTRVDVVLSENSVITSVDPTIGTSLHLDLEPRSEVTVQRSLQVPVSRRSGLSHLGVLVDPLLEIAELDKTNNIFRVEPALLIFSDDLSLFTSELPVATVDRAYHVALQAAGGDGDYTFSLKQSWLPDGLELSADGVIRGRPARAGRFVVDFEVRSLSAVDERRLELVVLNQDAPLTWITRQLPAGVLGADYQTQLRVAGGRSPYAISLTQGELPGSVQLYPDGRLEGRFQRPGLHTLTLLATDAAGAEQSQTLQLEVQAPGNLSIVSARLPSGELDQPYETRLIASGGVEPLSWRHLTPLPEGLVVHRGGLLAGIPEQAGSTRFIVEVVDGVGRRDTNAMTVSVEDRAKFEISPPTLATGMPGHEYLQVLRARAGRPPIVWEHVLGEGELAPGLKLRPGDGVSSGQRVTDLVIEGMPETPGVYPFTLRAIDSRGQATERAYAIVVNEPPRESSGCRSTSAGQAGTLALIFLLARRRRRQGATL